MEMNDLITKYELKPHPEGGYFRETYRSEFSTGIFYLLEKGDKSCLHKITSDEMWHFYGGDSIVIVEITVEGELKETLMNKDQVQYVVLANTWFGAYLPAGSNFALMGCTVSPAFHFKNFTIGNKEELLLLYPKASSMIDKML